MVDYDKLKFGKDGKVTISSLKDFLFLCSKDEVWDAWWELANEYSDDFPMTYKTFYRGLLLAYEDGKVEQDEGREMFEEVADYWLDYALKKDKDFYNSMNTDEDGYVTLYRGCLELELNNDECGISWTTNRGVAEFFAFRFERPDSVVIKSKVFKGEIASVITDRGEDEVIAPYIEEYEIVTREKTNYYDQYMKYREKHP